MGHTQFIPTTYQAYAVDFTGDGRRDIWADDPTDALGQRRPTICRAWAGKRVCLWGQEVRLPDGFNTGLAGARGHPQRLGPGLGLRAVSGSLTGAPASLILPDGPRGPGLFGDTQFSALSCAITIQSFTASALATCPTACAAAAQFRAIFQPDANGFAAGRP